MALPKRLPRMCFWWLIRPWSSSCTGARARSARGSLVSPVISAIRRVARCIAKPLHTHDPLAVMQDSFQRFARCERQMHALLHMHVVKEAPVQEIAELHGMSRSAVYRGLTRAKSELRRVYQSVTHERQLSPTAD